MDLFKENRLVGKALDNLCIDIIKCGFTLKHPSVVLGKIKILNKEQLEKYEEITPLAGRDMQIYLVSLVFIQQGKFYGSDYIYPWGLVNVPKNRKELRDLVNLLYDISTKTKNSIMRTELTDLYYKYEKYLPDEETLIAEYV